MSDPDRDRANGGFAPAALHFFDALEEDNSREFWQAHLEEFEREVKAPMAALLAALPPRYEPFRVFRMNRDVRFSNDKTPYKLQHSAIHESGGTDHYLHLDGGGVLVGAGVYQFEPDQLQRYRAAVDHDRTGPALERVLKRLRDRGVEVEGVGLEPLKTAPRGYPRDHPRIGLLRRKGVLGHVRIEDAALLRDGQALVAAVVELFDQCRPLVDWLRHEVGPSLPQGVAHLATVEA